MAKVATVHGSYEAILLDDDFVQVTTVLAMTGDVVAVERFAIAKCEAIAALLVEELAFRPNAQGVN
jgi:hypothetical protein